MIEDAIPVKAYTYAVCSCGHVLKVSISELIKDYTSNLPHNVKRFGDMYVCYASVRCPKCNGVLYIDSNKICDGVIVSNNIPITIEE